MEKIRVTQDSIEQITATMVEVKKFLINNLDLPQEMFHSMFEKIQSLQAEHVSQAKILGDPKILSDVLNDREWFFGSV